MPENREPYVQALPSYPWDALLRRLEGLGLQHAIGTHKINFSVMVHNGKPVLWFRPEVLSLEPKASGRQFLDLLESSDV